jgi:prepilin signal peptidase PulO-like enzyme (type II secretory pathway)
MVAGAAMVVFVTTVGPNFGATISGMLATIPTIAAVMAIFTHAQEGPDRTVGVMRGMTHGLLGFASFLTVLAATLEQLGVLRAFALGACAVVAVQFVELRSALRARRPDADVRADVAADLELPEAAE